MVFGSCHHDAINQHARYFYLTRIERAAFGNALDLRDHDAAGIARGHCDSKRFQRQGFLLHCQMPSGSPVVALMMLTLIGNLL